MNIAIIGDSHAETLGPLLSGLLTAAGHKVWSTAERGWSTRRFLQDRNIAALATDPSTGAPADRALVLLGGNDQSSRDQYAAELDTMLTRLRAAGVRDVIWVGPYKVRDTGSVKTRHDRVREWQSDFLPAHGATWLDGYALSNGLPQASDGVHFPRSSYTTMAQQIAQRAVASRLTSDKRRTVLMFALPVASLAIAAGIFYFTLTLSADQ